MGIFSKSNQKPSRDKSIKKRARVFAESFSANIHRINLEIGQELSDANPEVSEFAQRKHRVFSLIEIYLGSFLTQWDDEPRGFYEVYENWESYAEVVHNLRFSRFQNETIKLPVEEILEQVRYLNQSVKVGALVTMPGATIEQSRGYRGMISANLFSGILGWDWKNWSDNNLNIADHLVAELVTDSVTEIFDRYQMSSESGFAALFASFLLADWDSSEQRQELAKPFK